MAAFITVLLLLLFAVVLLAPTIAPEVTFDPGMRDTLKTFLTIGIGYYLNTTASSAKKDETIANLTKETNATP